MGRQAIFDKNGNSVWIPHDTLLKHFVSKYPHIKDAGACRSHTASYREVYGNIAFTLFLDVRLRESPTCPLDFINQTAFYSSNNLETLGLYVGYAGEPLEVLDRHDMMYSVVLFGSHSKESWPKLRAHMRKEGWVV